MVPYCLLSIIPRAEASRAKAIYCNYSIAGNLLQAIYCKLMQMKNYEYINPNDDMSNIFIIFDDNFD